ncbi:MAG: uroporphyrinogen decarboxylase family protein [Anaerolineae bacterium]|jgi:uroporphyrinogen decarboxylase
MKPKERVMCALAGEQPDRVPFCEGNIAANIARALAGSERDLSEREISDLVGRDVVVAIVFPPYFADHTVGSDGQSYVTTGWIKTWADLDKMVFPDPNDPELYAGAQKVLDEKRHYATAASIKLGVAPTLVSMGLDGFAYALYDDPDLVHEVLRRYVDWQLVVTQRLIEMGFDFLWSFDDVAYKNGPFCSPAIFRETLMPALQRSAEAITIPWVFHSDGNLMPILDDILSLGSDGLHPIEPGPMSLAEVKQRYGKRVCIIGNVSVDTLSAGTPQEVRQLVQECISTGAPGGGYMISSSNSVPSYARPENVQAMVEAIRKYGAYPMRE